MTDRSWEVHYPEGLMEHIELFRVDYIPYETYDAVLAEYLGTHVASGRLKICSLGCGTGQHEVNLARAGHVVLGLDRSAESIALAERNAGEGIAVDFCCADILREAGVAKAVGRRGPFDVAIMLGVQLSMADHAHAARVIRQHLRRGGAFVCGLWGYAEDFDYRERHHESCVEIAEGRRGNDFAVRLNTYTYVQEDSHFFIDWDAVYLYPGEDGLARMFRRQCDRIEVTPEREGHDPLGLAGTTFERLPSRTLVECGEDMCLPHTYEYLAGWRKL